MFLKKTNISYIAILLLVIGYVFFDYIVHFNSSVITLGGDGLKNYYCFLNHAMHGYGFHYTGMHYPFGDHVIYTDNEPLLSVPLSFLVHHFNLGIGFVNFVFFESIALSYFLASYYCFLFLNEYKVPKWLSTITSLLIVLLSPQLLRTQAHYGLSFAHIIPMWLYFILKFSKTEKKQYLLYLLLLNFTASFLHLYFAGLLLLMSLSFTLVYYCLVKENKIRILVAINAIPVFILGLVKVFLYFTDPILDRPTNPGGHLTYKTNFIDFIADPFSTIIDFFQDKGFIANVNDVTEGLCYLGIIPISSLLIIAFYYVFQILIHKKYPFLRTIEAVFFISAVLLLLFAMGLHLTIGMDRLFHYAPFLKQFRSLGRFSWYFYYVATLLVVVAMSKVYQSQLLSKKVRMIIIALACFIWLIDANGRILYMKQNAVAYKSNFDYFHRLNQASWESFLQSKGYSKNDFQCIAAVPFIHVGSDKIWREGVVTNTWMLSENAIIGYELGLPMMNALLARASWSQSFEQVKFDAGYFVDHALFKKLPSTKNILVLRLKEENCITPDQQGLLNACDSLGFFDEVYVYRLSVAQYLQLQQKVIDSCILAANPKHTVYYLNEFEQGTGNGIRGRAFAWQDYLKDTVLARIPVEQLNTTSLNEFSIWVDYTKDNLKYPYFSICFYNANQEQLQQVDVNAKTADDSWQVWYRAKTYFSIPKNTAYVLVKIMPNDCNNFIAIDRLEIRPIATSRFDVLNASYFILNNHILSNDYRR